MLVALCLLIGVAIAPRAAAQTSTEPTVTFTLLTPLPTELAVAAQDWPADEDWAAGVAPLAVRVGARFPGGRIVGATYLFGVVVA